MSRYYRLEFQHLGGIERIRKPWPYSWQMRLNRLENPIPLPDDMHAAVKDAVGDFNLYPDYQPFYEQLATFLNVPPANLVVGLGSEEFIRSIMLLACSISSESRAVAVLSPTCAMYQIHAAALNIPLFDPSPVSPKFELTLDMWLDVLDRRDFAVLFLPNPGQPIETYFSPVEFAVIAEYCSRRGTLLVVDEAYYGFGAETALPLIFQFDNVIVMRTFSKGWGGAALRIGYAVGCEELIKPLHSYRLSGEVAGPSMQIASVMIDRYESAILPAMHEIAMTRDWLRCAIGDLGLWAQGERGNHVLVELGADRAGRVGRHLEAEGIYINYQLPHPCEDYIMITVGSLDMMVRLFERFVGALDGNK